MLFISPVAVAPLLVALFVGTNLEQPRDNPPSDAPATVRQFSPLAKVLPRLGFNPRVIACSGITTEQAAAGFQTLTAALVESGPALTQLDASIRHQQTYIIQLESKSRTGRATPADMTALRTAKSQVSSAERARSRLLQQLRGSFTAQMSSEQGAIVRRMAEGSARGVSPVLLAAPRTPAELVRLRANPNVQDSQAAAVAQARTNLSTNLGAARQAWLQATGLPR